MVTRAPSLHYLIYICHSFGLLIQHHFVSISHGAAPVVFAPHVETSAGIMLPDAYITQLAAAAHASGVLKGFDSILFPPVFLSLCILLLLLPLLFLFAPHPPPGALLVLDCIASGCMWVDMKVFPAQSCGFVNGTSV